MKQRKRTNADYLKFLHFYFYRPLVYLILTFILTMILLLFHKDIQMLWFTVFEKNRTIPEYVYNDVALANYQGQLILIDTKGKRLYKGMFADGACNGIGVVYDARGKKKYQGMMVNNVMEDTSGSFYFADGTLQYQGEVHENEREGNGSEYYADGKICYEGAFKHNVFEGEGIQYDREGNIDYEGYFVDGKRHGKGILYESGKTTRRRYSGDFAFGYPQGDGIFYDTFGKAYFQGAAYEGHINYTSLLPETLADIETHFLIPYEIYVYEGCYAIVYKNQKLAFLCKDALPIKEDEKSHEWIIDADLDKKKVVFESIVMADENIDDTNANFQFKDILKTWQKKYVPYNEEIIMNAEDVFAIRLSTQKVFKGAYKCTSLIKKGNGIYELSYHQILDLSYRIVYPVEHMEIVYGFPIYEDKLLYSVMRERNQEREEEEIKRK